MSNVATITSDWTPAQLELIKSTICKNASDDELKLFLYRSKSMGLDPLKPGQIHFIKYGSNPGTIVIGREGFRSRAAATGKHAGTKVGIIRDSEGRCLGAWAEVYRKDWTEPAREEVSLAEYDAKRAQWLKMPETMIKKVAEVAALRMAFPDELGGIYSDDEMAQAEPPPNPLIEYREEKAAAQADPGEYVLTFGKWKGKALNDLDPYAIRGYCEYIVAKAKTDKQPIRGAVEQFLNHAEEWLAIRGNQEFERASEPQWDPDDNGGNR